MVGFLRTTIPFHPLTHNLYLLSTSFAKSVPNGVRLSLVIMPQGLMMIYLSWFTPQQLPNWQSRLIEVAKPNVLFCNELCKIVDVSASCGCGALPSWVY
jgi:hypothetical protein